MDSQRGGCTDIDECIAANTCTKQQFCVNTEGSFNCLGKLVVRQVVQTGKICYNNVCITECDKSCDGCDGDGPDMCKECADGFELRDGLCTGKLH